MPWPPRPRLDAPMKDRQPVLSQAVAAHQAGDLAQADRLYKKLLKSDPANSDALHLRGLIEFQRNRPERAIDLIERAILRCPSDPRYHANLGRVLQAAGRSEDAVQRYRRSLEMDTQSAEVHSDLAAALISLERFEPAAEACEAALNRNSDLADGHLNLGIARRHLGKIDQAIVAFDRALVLRPDHPFTLFQKGCALQARGDLSTAESCFRKVIEREPGIAEARCNLGNILKERGDFHSAATEYRNAVQIDPDLAEAHSNLGVTLQEMGESEEALDCFDRAVEIKSDDAETRRNRAMVLLQLGRFAEGWKEYEWRWQTRHFDPLRRHWDIPRWTGETLSGRKIHIHAEQGYGDTLQFIRYLPAIAAQSGSAVFECPQSLVDLARTVDPSVKVIAIGEPPPPADFHVPLMSLPGLLGTDLDSIPADIPYLQTDPDRLTIWQWKIPNSGRFRVGVAWRGSDGYKRDSIRSPGLNPIRPLFECTGCDFYSLQKDGGDADLVTAGLAEAVTDIADGFVDFADTAAAIACLDLVISADTAVAHLAGALGIPVWVLLPSVAEWRWLRNRDDSPWYPSARLFRQDRPGDWNGLVERVNRALGEKLAAMSIS
jgi:tetratricopeptide (TPR) repeat protein